MCLLILSTLLNACGGQQESLEKTKLLQSSTNTFGSAPLANATVQFSGPRNAYSITKLSEGFLISEIAGKRETKEVSDATTLRFADLSVNLQVAKNAGTVTAENLSRLIELYIAFFNRVPDADGLSYWIDRASSGMSLEQIAESFYQAALSYPKETGYSATMSNADFVKIIYKNVLGRTGVSAPPEQDVCGPCRHVPKRFCRAFQTGGGRRTG